MNREARGLPADPPSLRESDRELEVRPDMSLKRHVQGVSFPRSGHHLLVNFLNHYFGCRFLYCEYYNHCQQLPCANPANNLQKNHDFGLKLPTDGARDYVLQYRHPLYAVSSNYFLHLRNVQGKGSPYEVGQEPGKIWREFAVKQVQRWKAFVRKWILENDNPRVLVLAYEDILHRPVEVFSGAVQFLCPSRVADRDRIESLVAQMNISAKRNMQDFPRFDTRFFHQLEQRAREEIQAIGLPLVMSTDDPLPLVPQRRSAA